MKQIKNKSLLELLPSGVAIHHAGIESSDRKLVEKYFISEDIKVVCTTSTLA